MTKRFTTVNGQILFVENVMEPGKSMALVPDTLGNVIADKYVNGNIVRNCEYWPYGEIRTETDSNSTPFGYGGTWGYYSDPSGLLYVRARYYKPIEGRWLTVDPIWPGESAYGYVEASPSRYTDGLGMCKDCKRGGYTGNVGESCWCYSCIDQTADDAMHINDLLNHKIGPMKGKPSSFTNDQMNAIRHCYWSCISVQECTCTCARMIDIKEMKDGGGKDSKADLCNNCIGRELGDVKGAGCLHDCIKVLRMGKLCSAKTGLPFGFIGPPSK